MSLTNGTKDYWVQYFKDRITREVTAIREANLVAHNALKDQAQENAAARLGLTMLLADYLAAKAEYRRVDALRDEANKRVNEASAAVYEKVNGKKPNGYYRIEDSWERSLQSETDTQLQELLAQTDWGKEMAKLMKQANSIEVQIMLSTSPKQLVDFVQQKLGELGLEIE